jgi:Flp pilus assembly protein TadD
MMYCARCGEPVVDAFGRKPKPGPYDGLGSRGGIRARKPAVSAPAPEPEPPHEVGSTQAVEDLIVEYRNHLNEKPADHETRYALALAYMMGHQWAQAEAELVQVVGALGQYADAHARLAVCVARQQRPEEALGHAQRALALEPNNARYRSLVERLKQVVDNAERDD